MQSREAGDVSSFAEMLDNIFSPLFAVSIDPSCDPALHYFLGEYFTKGTVPPLQVHFSNNDFLGVRVRFIRY